MGLTNRTMPFVHLHVHSCYSFLDGASEPEELARHAAELGMSALALTDHNGVSGAVRFVAACEQYGLQPILGVEITMEDDSHLTLLAETQAGYQNITRLISLSHDESLGGGRRVPRLSWETLLLSTNGMICLSGCRHGRIARLVREHRRDEAMEATLMLRAAFAPRCFYLELQDDLVPDAARVCRDLAEMGKETGVPVVATNNVHFAQREGYLTHDLLSTIRTGGNLSIPHPARPLNAERYLKSAEEMRHLFAHWCSDALAATVEIAERCAAGAGESGGLPLGEKLAPQHPSGKNAPALLRELAYRGARERYGHMSDAICSRLDHELNVICTLGFEDYILTVRDIITWARSQNIRATGRGSAADSAVCYALRITDVDVIARGLPFARFLHAKKRGPDIDSDFPSDRRDEVFRHIQKTFGADRVGLACTFHTYHARGAIRDVGKALNLPADALEILSERAPHGLSAAHIAEAFDKFAELKPFQALLPRFHELFALCARIGGFPRHMGSHSSGILIARKPLTAISALIPSAKGVLPIFTCDKDDCETVGGLKYDVLALRILSSIADTETDIRCHDPAFDYDTIPLDDEPTYRLLQSGKQVGTFQFESSAQMSLSAEMLPETFDDLTAAVALIRPANNRSGARTANTVRRFLDARSGYVRADYLHPSLRPILAKTFGVPIFQEQIILMIAAVTGWEEPDSERFLKNLGKHIKAGTTIEAGEVFYAACLKKYPRFPKGNLSELWRQIVPWANNYGFLESHAASFALTGYKTSYLATHHTASFIAGILSEQPMGFWSPQMLVSEARRRGVTVLLICINGSSDKCDTDQDGRLRIGLRMVTRFGEAERNAVLRERERGGVFASLLDFCVRVVLRRDSLENLVLAGAFDGLYEHEHRRGLVLRLDETLSLAAAYRAETNGVGQRALAFGSWRDVPTPCAFDVPDFSPWEKLSWEWRITGVTTSAHPLSFHRAELRAQGVVTIAEALAAPAGKRVRVAGILHRPHRPPTRSGKPVLFVTIEDETDFAQTVCLGDAIERCTAVLLLASSTILEGTVERRGQGGTMIQVDNAYPLRITE